MHPRSVRLIAAATAFAASAASAGAAFANWTKGTTAQQAVTLGAFSPATAGAPGASVSSGGTVTITPQAVSIPAPTSTPAGADSRTTSITIGSWHVVRSGSSSGSFDCTTSCTDSPGDGTYSYTVAPTFQSWTGNASTAVTGVVVTTLTPLSLTTPSTGSIARRAQSGDSIAITFSKDIAPSTICSAPNGTTWTGSTVNNNNAITVTVSNNGAASDDQVAFSTSSNFCGSGKTLHIGTIDLGTTGYVATNGSVSFSGTGSNATSLTYNSATKTLTIVLGGVNTSGTTAASTTAKATYNPDGAIATSGGTTITGTVQSSGPLF